MKSIRFEKAFVSSSSQELGYKNSVVTLDHWSILFQQSPVFSNKLKDSFIRLKFSFDKKVKYIKYFVLIKFESMFYVHMIKKKSKFQTLVYCTF